MKNMVSEQEQTEIVNKIIQGNLDFFGKNAKAHKINAGFNNYVFNVDDKYIIKICGDTNNENLFDIESNFYSINQNNQNIPKLYKYDNSKTIIPNVYEIIEKIAGKTVYYHWYKWTEGERENFIEKFVDIIKTMHDKKYNGFDWCGQIKHEVYNLYDKTKEVFNSKEQTIIELSLEKYEKFLTKNNVFVMAHNDLHFDNILVDENSRIKIVDFNDSKIVPFDYDFRLLFMSEKQPWKWADEKMDPFQDPKDYSNLFSYIKKYYKELNEIPHLNERECIYSVLYNFRQLQEYKHKDCIENIIEYSKVIL